jgi:hypothetical protein
MTQERHTIKLALSCYPAWWRERYGDEVQVHAADMLADGRSPMALSISLLWGAARARWSARGMPRDYRVWAARNRVSIAAATLPWLLLVPIATFTIGNQKLGPTAVQDGPGRLRQLPAAPASRIVTLSGVALLILFLVTFLLLVGGWSHLVGGIRRSSAPDRARTLRVAWVPGITAAVVVIGFVVEEVLRPSAVAETNSVTASGRYIPRVHYLNGYPTAAHAVGAVLAVVAIAGWLLSIGCVGFAAKRAEVDPAALRYGTGLSAAVAALFSLLLAAYVTWGIGLTIQAREAAHRQFYAVTYSRQDLWLPMAALLGLGVAVSIASAWSARRSWNTLALAGGLV